MLRKTINIEIGERIREKRVACNYSRETLAELADISVPFLADVELGNKGMSLTTLKKLCEILCVSSDYIILGKTDVNSTNRIDELIKNVDSRYIPLLENIMADALQIINASKN